MDAKRTMVVFRVFHLALQERVEEHLAKHVGTKKKLFHVARQYGHGVKVTNEELEEVSKLTGVQMMALLGVDTD